MKASSAKLHILDVSEPLLAYRNLVMRCGITLKNAEPVYMIERQMHTEMSRPSWRICKDCLMMPPDKGPSGRYEYGLIEAEEFRLKAEEE